MTTGKMVCRLILVRSSKQLSRGRIHQHFFCHIFTVVIDMLFLLWINIVAVLISSMWNHVARRLILLPTYKCSFIRITATVQSKFYNRKDFNSTKNTLPALVSKALFSQKKIQWLTITIIIFCHWKCIVDHRLPMVGYVF